MSVFEKLLYITEAAKQDKIQSTIDMKSVDDDSAEVIKQFDDLEALINGMDVDAEFVKGDAGTGVDDSIEIKQDDLVFEVKVEDFLGEFGNIEEYVDEVFTGDIFDLLEPREIGDGIRLNPKLELKKLVNDNHGIFSINWDAV
jgi:hypothetical protein